MQLDATNIPFRAFTAPGRYLLQNTYQQQIINLGHRIRDEYMWDYPLLPGALIVFQQMASSREVKVSGKKQAVPRTVEWLNGAVTENFDGTVEYGFEQFLMRRAMDHNCIGRTVFHWKDGQPLRYLDPGFMYFNISERIWEYGLTQEKFPANELVFNHAIPLGGTGRFMSPVFEILPSAMMAWLIREHDAASADGRKIRDLILVGHKDIKEHIEKELINVAMSWSGANVTSNNVSVIAFDDMPQGMKAEDYIARFSIANIPPSFDIKMFYFLYANQIANNLGLSMRNFWNVETGTNRALEEVQEARQTTKGPAFFVRSEQRHMNRAPIKQFGPQTRMGFIEEVDSASKKVNAEVLKAYSESLKAFAEVFGGQINGDAFLAWLQSEDILPADLDLITDMGTMQNPDANATSQNPDEMSQEADQKPTPGISEVDDLDYGEITMTLGGDIIERREKVISINRILTEQYVKDQEFRQKTIEEHTPKLFIDALIAGRKENLSKFKQITKWPVELAEDAQDIQNHIDDLTDGHHRKIKILLDKVDYIE